MKSLKNLLKKHHSDDHNLIGAIEKVIEAKADPLSRRKFAPFHRLPDVSSVRIELSPWDELFASFGLKRRVAPATMHYIKYKNEELNRYLLHQIERLKASEDPKKFYRLAQFLIERSLVFYLVGLKHICPRWHRDLPFWKVLKMHQEYSKICQIVKKPKEIEVKSKSLWEANREIKEMVLKGKGLGPIDYKRVYIEKKAKGKWRGLGVPTIVWRLYLHNLNQMLVLRLDKSISENQHAYRPFKGTLTAWKKLLEIMNKYKFIYEIDFQGFFPNLDVKIISKVLESHKVPRDWVDIIENINTSMPKLAAEHKIDESQVKLLSWQLLQKRLREHFKIRSTGRWRAFEKDKDEKNNYNSKDGGSLRLVPIKTSKGIRYKKYWFSDKKSGYYVQDLVEMFPEIFTKKKDPYQWDQWEMQKVIGVPQGAPTSPFLAILVLNWALPKTSLGEWLIYADDVLWFSNYRTKPRLSKRMKEANISYAPEKCGWVKRFGIWKTTLKFLGLIYDGKANELRADTVKGSKLIYDKDSLLEAMNEGYLERTSKSEGRDTTYSWNKFIHSTVSGYLFARMYTGSWNLENYYQNFRLSYKKGSWVETYQKWVHNKSKLGELMQIKLNVFNSSSLCLISALEALKEARQNKYTYRRVNLVKNLETIRMTVKNRRTGKVVKETILNHSGKWGIIQKIRDLASWLD